MQRMKFHETIACCSHDLKMDSVGSVEMNACPVQPTHQCSYSMCLSFFFLLSGYSMGDLIFKKAHSRTHTRWIEQRSKLCIHLSLFIVLVCI